MVKSSGGWFSQLQEAQASTKNCLTSLNEQIGNLHIQIFRYLMSRGSRSNRQVSSASLTMFSRNGQDFLFWNAMPLKRRADMILQLASLTLLLIPAQLNHQNFCLFIWRTDLSNLIPTRLKTMKAPSYFLVACRTLSVL